MAAALLLAIMASSKARELDAMKSDIAIIEAEIDGLWRDIEELQAHVIEAKEAAELEAGQ